MSPASDNRSDKHTRKCAQIYKQVGLKKEGWRQCDDRKYKRNTIKEKLEIVLFFFAIKIELSGNFCNIFSWCRKALWRLMKVPFHFVRQSKMFVKKTEKILRVNEVWSTPCHRNSPFLTSVGFNRCSAQLSDSAGSPWSQGCDWLAVEIEPDGNWLHITYLLQLKKVSSQQGINIKKKVGEWKNRGAIHIRHSSLSFFKVIPLPAGTGRGGGGRGLMERGQAWQLSGAKADIEGQVDRVLCQD